MSRLSTPTFSRRVLAVVVGLSALLASGGSAWAGGTAGVTPPGSQMFPIYSPPDGTNGQHTADEPSIGANWNTGAVMYQSLLATLRVTFDDTASPQLQPGLTCARC